MAIVRRLARRFVRNFLIIFAASALLGATALRTRKRHEPTGHDGFDLYVSREEMNRTLGILAEMNYVTDGVINAYSTKFPYRIAPNISYLMFTWRAHSHKEQIKYNLQVKTEDFGILSVLHVPTEGYLPSQPETFAVEYRCAGSRAGQFQVTLLFEVSWPSEETRTTFQLRQEKICVSFDGRRTGSYGVTPILQFTSHGILPIDTRQILIILAAIFGALLSLCAILACISTNASRKRNYNTSRSALASIMDAGAAAHSFYTAAAMLGRNGFNDQVCPATNFCAATNTTTTQMSSSTAPITTCTSTIATAAAKASTSSSIIGRVVNLDDALTQPLCLNNNNDDESDCIGSQPLTSTPYASSKMPRMPKFNQLTGAKIIYERRSNSVDIKNALVELNADRNLFVVMPQVELEGKFGEIRWANWRQTGIGTSGDIDDEEDDANEDTALICKTLKVSANRSHFEAFLRDALVLHNVPFHINLAQVFAAATFGNFINPESVKDFPLICYRHSGFGILKKFLCTCRGINGVINASEVNSSNLDCDNASAKLVSSDKPRNLLNPTLRIHDLVSIAAQVLKAVRHLHTFGVIHKDIAARNCLISEVPVRLTGLANRLHVQLADNALSRDIFSHDYAEMIVVSDVVTASPQLDDVPTSSSTATTNRTSAPDVNNVEECFRTELFPVKWMAPEAIRSKVFNSSTDVWNFGMFMWELFTCGQTPFDDIAAANVELAIASGARPPHPTYNCPDDIYDIMFSCWNHDPLQRPSTEQLLHVITDFAHQLRRYI